MQRLLFIALFLCLAKTCSIEAVHITTGSLFESLEKRSDPSSTSNIYMVGFSSSEECKEEDISVNIWLPSKQDSSSSLFKHRVYTAPEGSGVVYTKHFYFIKILYHQVMTSPCQFDYQIRVGEKESTVFGFKSQFFCNQYYKVISFGQHDNTKIGMRLIDSAKHQSFDLLILIGNFVTGYHLKDGSLGDQYFHSMEILTSRTLTFVVPGRRELFDEFKMFQSRFMMTGCHDDLECPLTRIADSRVNFYLLNLQGVASDNEKKKELFHKVTNKLEESFNESLEAGENKWDFIFTNTDFNCSINGFAGNCMTSKFMFKEFDDLFDLYDVNLIVSSEHKIYESIRDTFNFEGRCDGQPRNYVISGLAGSTNTYVIPGFDTIPDLSFNSKSHMQAVFSLDVFSEYYKMDLLDVPNFTSIDLRFIRMNFDWDKVQLYCFFIVGMLVVFYVFEYYDVKQIGMRMASKKSEYTQSPTAPPAVESTDQDFKKSLSCKEAS